jgi:hypothetical protein
MNRQSLTISAALLAVVVVVVGVVMFVGEDDARPPLPTGPGQASEARSIIQEIQERSGGDAAPAPAVRQPQLLEQPTTAASEPAARGAVAETPAPVAAAPAGADAALDEAFEQAMELQADGKLDDAQVLLFFGARRGHARSAFAYAEMNDPLHHSAETSLLAEPDAFQAYRWYSAAVDGGVEAADDRLESLRVWAVDAAAAGDGEAERLLLQWEQ